MNHTLIAIVSSGVLQAVLQLVLLAFFFGRLSQKVEVLWMAVFNHLGQDERVVWQEWRKRRQKQGAHRHD